MHLAVALSGLTDGSMHNDTAQSWRDCMGTCVLCMPGRRGELTRSGVRVAIVGAPNVGKSSLLNAVAARDAAIVSAAPGTTRDAIEVAVDLGGYKV